MAPRKKKVKGPPKKRGRPAAKRIGSGKAVYPMGAGKMGGSGPHYLHKDRYIEVPVDRVVEKVVREQPKPSIAQRIKSVADIIQTVGYTAKATHDTIESVRKTSAYVQDLVGIKPSSFLQSLHAEPARAQPAPTAQNFEGRKFTFIDRGTVGYQPSGQQEERRSDEARQIRQSRQSFQGRSQARQAQQEARREIRDINVEMSTPPVEARNFETAEFTGIPQVAPTAAFTMGAVGAVGDRGRRNRAAAQQAQREAEPVEIDQPDYSFSYPGAREFTFKPTVTLKPPTPMDTNVSFPTAPQLPTPSPMNQAVDSPLPFFMQPSPQTQVAPTPIQYELGYAPGDEETKGEQEPPRRRRPLPIDIGAIERNTTEVWIRNPSLHKSDILVTRQKRGLAFPWPDESDTFRFRPSTPRFYRENVADLPYISNVGGWEMPPEGKKRRAANISQIGLPNPNAREKRKSKKTRI